jgi:hypothetical protein
MTFLSPIFFTMMVSYEEEAIPEELLRIWSNYILKMVSILKKLPLF